MKLWYFMFILTVLLIVMTFMGCSAVWQCKESCHPKEMKSHEVNLFYSKCECAEKYAAP